MPASATFRAKDVGRRPVRTSFVLISIFKKLRPESNFLKIIRSDKHGSLFCSKISETRSNNGLRILNINSISNVYYTYQ